MTGRATTRARCMNCGQPKELHLHGQFGLVCLSPGGGNWSPTGSRAATDLRYCCDCRGVTTFADPAHCVPCCWNCLKKLYPDCEFAEGMSEGRFDRERVYREAGIGNG